MSPLLRATTLLLAAAAALAAAPETHPASVAAGSYECWAFSSARMGLNFQVTGSGRYKDSEGVAGSYSYDPATGRIAFKGGLLQDAMPQGFYSVYHEPKGRPTVSFRSARGSEASFCELKR